MSKRRRLNRELVITQAVEMTALAQTLGIRPPSLYNHVASLEDLQAGMAAFGLRQLITDLRRASLGQVGQEAVVALANAYRQFAHAHPGIYPLTVRAPEPDETERVALSQELIQMLLLVMASMGLQGNDAIHAIRGLRAILHGFASLEAAGGYKMVLELEESFHRLVSAYLNGLSGNE